MASPSRGQLVRQLGIAALLALLMQPTAGGFVAEGRAAEVGVFAPPDPAQMAATDRLARPVLGESPTQVEVGRYQYYYNCMPCHGDRGQGLTDEWRQVWVEDHQNCWARGCHTGKSELAAFYIPRVVPALVGLSHFQTAEALFTFLRDTQPPQRPGTLTEAEYWALTAFLLFQDGRFSADAEIGPPTSTPAVALNITFAALLAILLALVVGAWTEKQQCKNAE